MGFRLLRLMEKWENVSSPVHLTTPTPFFKAAFVTNFVVVGFFFTSSKVTTCMRSSRRNVGGLHRRQEDQER